MEKESQIIIFETQDKSISLPVMIADESAWINRNQMAELFGRDVKTIGKHINNALREELSDENAVVAKFATTAADGKTYMTEHYNLDVIVSVGYRVKSKRGVEFRRWANSVLKEYIIKGYAVNHNRMNQLNEVIRVMKRVENSLDTRQVLTVVERYSQALDLGNMVFVSGQIPVDPATGTMADTVEQQAAQSLANLKAILAEAGLSMNNVVKTVIFLADINDFAAVNAVYAKAFAEPFPARSCVQVAAIPKGAKLEIECIAARG